MKDHNFSLHRTAFQDALCLRYSWQTQLLPSTCICVHSFDVDHALCCPTGAFRTTRHSELRDFTAELLREVCPDVSIEPPILPLTGESLTYSTVNRDDYALLDVKARGFWRVRQQCTYFDVIVFNANASSYHNLSLKAYFRRHGNIKVTGI